MAKEFSFKDLNKEMDKISKYGDTMDKSTVSEIDHYISTGNYHLNACLTGSIYGGYPNNRAVALAGPSGCLQKNEVVRIYKMKSSNGKRSRKINTE